MFQLPADASQNVVLTVCATHDGSLWAGTEGAGIFRWRQDELTSYGAEQGLENLHISALFEDNRSNLWVGTAGGLFRLRSDRFEPVEGSPALQTAVMSLFEDRRGHVWAGTRGGLARFSDNDVRLYTRLDGLGGAPVRAMAEDGEGRMWVAIETAGIFRKEGDRFEQLNDIPDGLSTGARAIYCDGEGTVWFATRSSGLFRWKAGKLDEWNAQEDGLPSSRCFGLLEDNVGNLWLSSESGIFGLARHALDSQESARLSPLSPWRLTQSDGLAHNVCTGGGQPSASKSRDGLLWFGNGPGVAAFDPGTVPKGTRVWPPLIEEVLADGKRLSIEQTRRARVKSGVAAFEFRYTSPNIINPQRLKFRYRLIGVDKSPVEAGNRRIAYYTHLLPGSYKFEVQAATPNGEWRSAANDLTLVVVPRLYERRIVQIAAGLLLLAAVAATAWRLERARSLGRLERLRLQNAMDRERQRIARDIHDDLGSGLTEIILLSDNLRDELPYSPPAEKMVEEISTRARTLTRTMDEVVWAVNPRNDTLESFLTYFNKFVQEYLNRAGIRCRMDVPLDLPSMPLPAEARHNLYLASKEALNNVVKHSGASEVWIRLQPGPGTFVLSIEDNGHGFDTTVQRPRGNGLQNMQRRLEELQGRCEIQSKPGEGTRVSFQMNLQPVATGNAPAMK
jgi:signal transduction histidine kinase/streptogramin lyase